MKNVQRYRAVCPEPQPCDVFLVLLINGKRVAINPVSDYPEMRMAAERVALANRCHVKLLPLAGDEVLSFLGITPGQFAPDDPAMRQLDIRSCVEVMLKFGSGDECEDVLRRLGTMQ